MGSNTINKLPEGFVLDQPELPEGFVLDARPPLDPAEEERQIKDTVGMSESTGISVSHVNSNYKEMQGKSKPPVWRNVAAGYGALPKTKSGEFLADARSEVRSSLDNIQSSHDLADAVMGGQGVVEAYEKWDKQQERAQFRAEVIETSGPVKSIILKNIATAAPMLKSLYEASPFAFGGAVVGMGIATIVGAGAPAPEELLTVPAAGKIGAKAGFAIGAKLGMTASTAEFWYRQGLGDFYGEMIKSGADPKIAKIVAPIAAIPYAAIEYAQISQFTPGLRMGAQQVIARSVTKVLADAGRQYGKTLMQEALFEEVLQESVNIAAVDLANYFSGNDIKFDKEAFLDRANRLMVTGLESLKSMALLPGPNAAVDIATGVKQSVPSGAKTVEEIAKNYDKRIEKAKTPVQEQALKELKAFEEEQLVEPEAKTVEKAPDAPAKPPKPAEATVTEGKGDIALGVDRKPVVDTSLRELSDKQFGDEKEKAEKAVDALEDQISDDTLTVDAERLLADPKYRQDLADAQDRLSAIENEDTFRNALTADIDDVVDEIVGLRINQHPREKVKAIALIEAVKERGAEKELQQAINRRSNISADERSFLQSQLEDIKKLGEEIKQPSQKALSKPTPAEAKGKGEGVKLTKKQQASVTRLNTAVEGVIRLSKQPENKARRKYIEGDMETIRVHAGRLGIDIPKRSTYYNQESDIALAEAVREALNKYTAAPVEVAKEAVKKERDILGGVDPITQINKALKDAVEIRPRVESERKAEQRKRVGAAAGTLKSSLKKGVMKAEDAIGRSTGLLKGPLSDARYESIRDIMEDASPGAVDEAFRSIGESEKLTYFEVVNTWKAFEKLIDGLPITLREVEMIRKHFGIEMGEIAKSRAEKSSLSDRLWNFWRAGLLTGMKTSMLNEMSNLTHSVMETTKDLIAAPVDEIASWFTGKRTVAFTTKGIPEGALDGVKKGWNYMKTGVDERHAEEKYDYVPINYGNSKAGKAVQVYVETIFHLMGAEDQPFFYGAFARSLNSQAIAQAKTQKLKGQEYKDFIEKTRKTPSGEMLENAMHDAEMAVFQNRTVLGDIASHIQKAPVVRWAVPFSRTPSAVAMQIINYTPVGAMGEVMSQIKKGEFNQRDFSHAVGRSVVGMPVLAAGALLLAKGLMTLDYPDGERERKLWELEGKKPFAIKIGDKWRSLYVLGPAGNVLIIGAYFQKAVTESGSPSEAIVTAMAGGGKSFTEQTFVTGMSRAIDAVKDPERSFDRFFTGMAGSFVPTIVADIAAATDYSERQYKGPWQGIVKRVPGARRTLEERLNVFGQDLPRYGGNPLEVMIDASRPSKIHQDVVVDELRRLWDVGVKVSPTQLGNRDGYKVLTQEENTVLWRQAGKLAYQELFEQIKKRKYLRKDDKDKGKLIEEIVKEAKDTARAEAAQVKLNQGKTLKELKDDGLVTIDVERKL